MPDLAVAVSVEVELRSAAERLRGAGVAAPRREADRLWWAVTGDEPMARWAIHRRQPSPDAVARYREAVRRRGAGEPFAYAAGTAAFRLLELDVDRRVLIPRPETEGLVQRVLDWAGRRGEAVSGAEIGVGSGCVVLSLASEGPFRRLVGTDCSAGALEVARRNAERVRPPVHVEWRLGSLFAPLRGDAFDVIVANPPYLTEDDLRRTDPSVREYEPHEALVSGDGGMAHVRALCAGAASHLRPGGLLALEIDHRRADLARDAAREAGFTATVETDLFGRKRYLLAVGRA